MLKSAISFFVHRPKVVNLLMVLVILGGIFSLQNMGLQAAAPVDFGIYTVSAVKPGASAEKMELGVTVPLEEELLEVDGINRLTSKTMEGLVLIELRAVPGTDEDELDEIQIDIQKAIDRAQGQLPNDLLEQPLLKRISPLDAPTAKLAVTGSASEEVLRKVTRNLEIKLRANKDVTSLERFGYRDKQVRILLDPQKIAQFNITFTEIETAINGRNVTESGGSLASFIGKQDVIVLGEFANPDDVGDVVVRAGSTGDYLRLSDIAEVVVDYEDWRTRYFYQGRPAILLDVVRNYRKNELVFGEELKAIVSDFNETTPANVYVEIVADASYFAQGIVTSLLDNALIGLSLIILTLLIFFPWRFMVWVVAGLPVAILIAITISFSQGMVITAASLVAIILMLGMLVDDAIVTSESIYRFHEQGYPPREAAVMGLHNISKPILTGAVTTMVAMSPMLLVGGHDGKFLWYIPAVVVFMMIGSLFECFCMLPSHVAESLESTGTDQKKAAWFSRVEVFYRSVLSFYMLRPYQSVLALVAFLIFSLFVVSQLLIATPYPAADGSEVGVKVKLPADAVLADTVSVMLDIEEKIHESDVSNHIVYTYVGAGEHSFGGLNNVIEGEQENWGKVYVRLDSHNDRSVTAVDIAAYLESYLLNTMAMPRIEVKPINVSPPVGRALELSISGEDEHRSIAAQEIMAYLKTLNGVIRASTDYSDSISGIEVLLNYEKLADYQLTVGEISKVLQVAYNGIIVEDLQTEEELIRYSLQMSGDFRSSPEALYSLNIVSSQGELVPLRNVADFVVRETQSSISHFRGLRAETIIADVDLQVSSATELNQLVEAFVKESHYYERFPGISFNYGGEIVGQQESADRMKVGFLVVVTTIFFLMVLLFNSLSLPLVILLVIPVALISVALLFSLQGTIVTITAGIGFLGLIGVLVNGSLVMIDQVQKLHKERGVDHDYFDEEDIIEGAVIRLRPLVITGITSLVGLGPAAYGVAGSDPATQPMLLVTFWGVAVGSLAILFALPIYLVLHSRISRYWHSRKRLSEAHG